MISRFSSVAKICIDNSHSVKGLLVNVEASKNAWGLSFENVFIFIQEITVDMVAEKWCNPFD